MPLRKNDNPVSGGTNDDDDDRMNVYNTQYTQYIYLYSDKWSHIYTNNSNNKKPDDDDVEQEEAEEERE